MSRDKRRYQRKSRRSNTWLLIAMAVSSEDLQKARDALAVLGSVVRDAAAAGPSSSSCPPSKEDDSKNGMLF